MDKFWETPEDLKKECLKRFGSFKYWENLKHNETLQSLTGINFSQAIDLYCQEKCEFRYYCFHKIIEETISIGIGGKGTLTELNSGLTALQAIVDLKTKQGFEKYKYDDYLGAIIFIKEVDKTPVEILRSIMYDILDYALYTYGEYNASVYYNPDNFKHSLQ